VANVRIMGFKTEYKNGKGTDMVQIAPMGEAANSVSTWRRISEIRPPANADELKATSPSYMWMAAVWSDVGPAYEHWRRGEEIPDDGTPLAAWAGLSVEQATVLKSLGFRTVESVMGMTENAISRMPFPGARKLPKMAADYLAGTSAAVVQAENEALRARLEALEEMMAAAPEKRGPGRPRKADAEQTA